MNIPTAVRVIDSHTAGEPTRVVLFEPEELPAPLREGPLSARRVWFRDHADALRRALVCEPRGSDVLVGALLVPPHEPGCAAGVVYFNNAGVLGMCGHATIGLAVTLAYLGRLGPGAHRLDTPVGIVPVSLNGANRVTFVNVPSYRHRAGVTLNVPGVGPVSGDVAYGGNWFFLAPWAEPLVPASAERLVGVCRAIRAALVAAGVTGAGGAEIDHIELFGPPLDPANGGRNFVLCPGGAYDRSPCGTGTSAKLACLVADGRRELGSVWRQEGLLGGVFEAVAALDSGGAIRPTLTGSAFVTAEATLYFDPADPLRDGVRS